MIALPNSIYSRILVNSLDKEKQKNFFFTDANKIADMVENEFVEVGLIPLYDLVKFKEFFVSKMFGITFDAMLSYSYIYFKPGTNNLSKFYLYGDVTENEKMLTKIIFRENFDIETETIETKETPDFNNNNYVICGDYNLNYKHLKNAISFSEEICDLIKLPYPNFIFVAKNKENLSNIHKILEKIDYLVDDYLDNFTNNLTKDKNIELFLRDNQTSIFYTITEAEELAMSELIKLAYYHGIFDDMIDIKFVE